MLRMSDSSARRVLWNQSDPAAPERCRAMIQVLRKRATGVPHTRRGSVRCAGYYIRQSDAAFSSRPACRSLQYHRPSSTPVRIQMVTTSHSFMTCLIFVVLSPRLHFRCAPTSRNCEKVIERLVATVTKNSESALKSRSESSINRIQSELTGSTIPVRTSASRTKSL
ncbi:MAG: hypothetical protein JWM11_2191 [Planctomycetaceae bacterium]|nr:hypothetical protein [Planctomycetaceae bacterium]